MTGLLRAWLLATCIAGFLVVGSGAPTQAGQGWPYRSGYYGYYHSGTYAREYIPYFAQHPPVYYSYPVARPYGYSPYPYPPGYSTPELYEPRPALIRNQHVTIKRPVQSAEESEEPTPLRIINPYVEQAGEAREASTRAAPAPKPQIVHPVRDSRRST